MMPEHHVKKRSDGSYRWHQTRARPVQDGPDSLGADWVGTMTDVHDMRDLQDRQQMLMAELQRRTEICSRSYNQSRTRRSGPVHLSSRSAPNLKAELGALRRVQADTCPSRSSGYRFGRVGECRTKRARRSGITEDEVEGPEVGLPATSAQALSLALHELATNAIKYGALSQSAGKLWCHGTLSKTHLILMSN